MVSNSHAAFYTVQRSSSDHLQILIPSPLF